MAEETVKLHITIEINADEGVDTGYTVAQWNALSEARAFDAAGPVLERDSRIRQRRHVRGYGWGGAVTEVAYNENGIPLHQIVAGDRVRVHDGSERTATATVVRMDSPTWGLIELVNPFGSERLWFSAHNVVEVLDDPGPADSPDSEES